MNKHRVKNGYVSGALALGLSGLCLLPAGAASPSAQTVWNFNRPGEMLAASVGPASLGYRDPKISGWGPMETTFASARSLDLPLVNGVNAPVMAIPATTPDQGYTIVLNSRPNGAYAKDGLISNYTLVMDIFLPFNGKNPYLSLYQTSAGNFDDADIFVDNKPGGGVGVDDYYHGALTAGSWHRVGIAVQCNTETGQIIKFVDGRFVGGQRTLPNGGRCRWALEPVVNLFTDNDGETDPVYLTSLMYVDRVLSMKELATLGGPSGRGANVPGPLPAAAPVAARRVMVIGHRGESGSCPENTLAGIKQAFDDGADVVQVDVRLSGDGVPVLMHDGDVRRTTDGSGSVFGKTLAQLKKLDAGSTFDSYYAGERIPTLAEALQAAKGRGKLFIDAKGPGMGRYILKALKDTGMGTGDIWLLQGTSHDPSDYRNNLAGAAIFWDDVAPGAAAAAALEALRKRGISGLNVDETAVTKEFVSAAHTAGLFVSASTVLDPGRMTNLIGLGVDAVQTPYPFVLNSMLPAKK